MKLRTVYKMITYVDTSIFESPAQVLVNAVNTQGIMGKGIAKTFKELYPEMFSEYRTLMRTQATEYRSATSL